MTTFVHSLNGRVYNLDYLRDGGWVKRDGETLWCGYFDERRLHEVRFDCDPTMEGQRLIIPGTGLAKAYNYDSSKGDAVNGVWSCTSEIIAWSINPVDLSMVQPICVDGLQDISNMLFLVRNGKRWEEIGVASYTDETAAEEARRRAERKIANAKKSV